MDGQRILNADGYDIVHFNGFKISTAMFEFFSSSANEGTLFKLVSTDGNVATVERVPPSA